MWPARLQLRLRDGRSAARTRSIAGSALAQAPGKKKTTGK
jgi:hypothetical protein